MICVLTEVDVDTVHTVERSYAAEQAEIDERFEEIVRDIEALPMTPEELKELEGMPVAKDAGSQDQGYRFN